MYKHRNQSDFLRNLVERIEALETNSRSYQTQIQHLEDRQTYLEYDLHAKNGELKDKLSRWQQEPDYSDENYCSHEDSSEREYSAERLGNRELD